MIIEMLFVEGNHFCMFCEKSGNCELQALAYRFGITAPRFPYSLAAARSRRIASRHHDRPQPLHSLRPMRANVARSGRQARVRLRRVAAPRNGFGVNAAARLADTNVDVTDQAIDACPGRCPAAQTGRLSNARWPTFVRR